MSPRILLLQTFYSMNSQRFDDEEHQANDHMSNIARKAAIAKAIYKERIEEITRSNWWLLDEMNPDYMSTENWAEENVAKNFF